MNDADSKKWEEIKGYRQDVGDTTDDEFWWIDSKLAEQDREIERLQGIERIAQQLVNEWNEFEEPIALEWDMPDPMRTIHEWACDWYSRAEKAEARVKELEEEIIEREKRERYLADSNAEFVELLPQKDTHIGELEKGISEIIDCVAKVSVDIHHSEPGEEWRSPPFLAEKEKV